MNYSLCSLKLTPQRYFNFEALFWCILIYSAPLNKPLEEVQSYTLISTAIVLMILFITLAWWCFGAVLELCRALQVHIYMLELFIATTEDFKINRKWFKLYF